jgi:SpoVK/Ycf46/Vps4 family AAA+-type ATPase
LTAKAIAAAWAMPLLRLDMGALRSKYVGESEQNIRKALQVAETVSPCVLWLDEIEKSLAGASGPAGDGGVAADALGAVLSWMQERTGSVFVIATANDVRALPPELLRKGRFDELFFVDLPTTEERAAIVDATLRQFNRAGALVNEDTIARATAGFTGAELAALVPDALFTAFADGARDLTTADLLAAAANVVPLSKTAADKIDAVRAWAKGRARPASAPEATTATTGRALDL